MVKIKLILATVAFQVAASSVAFEFENPFKPKDEMEELFIKNPKAYWDRIYNFKWENINGQFIYDKNAFAKNVHGIALMRIQVNADGTHESFLRIMTIQHWTLSSIVSKRILELRKRI